MNTAELTLSQVRYTNKTFWRNPASAFFIFAFPLMFLVIFTALLGHGTIRVSPVKVVDISTYYVEVFTTLVGEMRTEPCPSSAVKMTRNMSGKAKMKKAEAGLRQNALFVYRTCDSVSAVAFMTCAVLSRRPAPGWPASRLPALLGRRSAPDRHPPGRAG